MRLPQLCHKPDGLFVFGVLVFLHSCFKIVSTQPGVNLSPSLIFKFNLGIFTARQRSLRRLCFYTCLSVILFTGRGVPGQVPSPTGGRYTPQAGIPWQVPPRQVHPPPTDTPPRRYTSRHSACWDMVKKRAVRIPLECILVSIKLFLNMTV